MGNCATCVDSEIDRKNEAFISPNKMRCEDNKDKFLRKAENNKENVSPKPNRELNFEKSSPFQERNPSAKKYQEMISLQNNYEPEVLKLNADSPHVPKDMQLINSMPDYSNMNTQATIRNLGEFSYEAPEEIRQEFENLPFYGPVFIDDRSIYEGQWKNSKRHGKGKQYWTDGSVYDGYWVDDMANVYGRLIHSDGDAYEGEWFNDKAQGKGLYIHKDGARYEGDWFEDKQHGHGKEKWIDGASYEGGYIFSILI